MSKALNELKKATLGSYLKKAADRHGKIAANIGALAGAAAIVAPGATMSKDELEDHLGKKAMRQSVTGAKGMSRAIDRLTKEEITEETLKEYKNTESHPSLWDTHQLVHKSGRVLKKGDKVKTEDGTHKIVGFELPHHSGSSGRVYVHDKHAAFKMASYFPNVVDAKIVAKKAVKEEALDEVSRSTIVKVATARYNQAQDALKKKDFGGYVKKMGKAIKASDATTPKTGWSPEDDSKKNEEFELKEGQILFTKDASFEKAKKALGDAGVPHSHEKREAGGSIKWKSEHQKKAKKALGYFYDQQKQYEEVSLTGIEKYRQIREAAKSKGLKSTNTHHSFYVAHDDLQNASKALKAKGIPHHVTDHSKAPVDHSAVAVLHKHSGDAGAALKAKGIDFGGR